MKYKVNDRVAFMVRRLTFLGIERLRKVGCIKQVRNSLFGTRYVINVSRSEEVHIVPERNIFHKVERKDNA